MRDNGHMRWVGTLIRELLMAAKAGLALAVAPLCCNVQIR
jgi:hypothetical protein